MTKDDLMKLSPGVLADHLLHAVRTLHGAEEVFRAIRDGQFRTSLAEIPAMNCQLAYSEIQHDVACRIREQEIEKKMNNFP